MDNAFGVILLILIIGAVFLFQHLKNEQRRKEIQAWGEGHGFEFDPARMRGIGSSYPQTQCFHKGSNRYGKNFVRGSWNGNAFLSFDYHYQVRRGKRTQHFNFSVVILKSEIVLEPLLIRPEGAFDKVKQFFGFDDINFESAEFSSKFHVSAHNKKWAYDVLHPRAIEYILGQSYRTLGRMIPSIQFERESVILFDETHLLHPEELEKALDYAAGFLKLLPDYVKENQPTVL